MKGSIKNKATSTFVSANGFTGFRSQYDKVFRQEEFKRIFVIKGGPGTGKSTLMRKIADRYKEKVKETIIYCSSDPTSLDGVILSNGSIKIGLVDATAPHERDAQYPGVCDEIINLGEALNPKNLSAFRERIFALASLKKSAYKKGYDILALSGSISRYVLSYFNNCDIYNWAEGFISNLFIQAEESIDIDGHVGYSSAFSRYGRCLISDFLPRENDYIIHGNGFSDYLAMQSISMILRERNIRFVTLPSPLSDDMIDVIITPNFRIYAGQLFNNSTVISPSKETVPIQETKISGSPISLPDNLYCIGLSLPASLGIAYEDSLRLSSEFFKEASDSHFALEKIYSSAMDFSKCEIHCENIISKIDALL